MGWRFAELLRKKIRDAIEDDTLSDNAHKACIKPIMCLENGTIFNSIALAAQAIGVHPHSIGDCVRGKQKTSGGFHWAYIPQKED